MKKLLLILCILPVFFTCNVPWQEDERKMFIDECVNRSAGVEDFDVEEYCQCMQGRIEKKYRVDELGKITMTEMSRLAELCINEQEGNDHHHDH